MPMKLSTLTFLALMVLVSGALRAEETVTVGWAVVPVPDGWKQEEKDNTLVLTPGDLPAGVTCTFTLLGGDPFDGALKDQMAAEWKGFLALGTMANEVEGPMPSASGAAEILVRGGRIDNPGKNSAYVLLFLAKANQRVEKMILVASTPEAMQKYGHDAGEMVSRATFVQPKAADPLQGGCFGVVKVK